jgi:cytoplasmic iron level regulating protein YaaA (DUF328/UPF0246 family)
MISVISPAKTLDFSSDLKIGSAETPLFLDEASKVNRKLKSLSANKLMSLQGISENLANQNFKRNQDWLAEDIHLGRQAVLAFKGDVYLGLEAEHWSEEDICPGSTLYTLGFIWFIEGQFLYFTLSLRNGNHYVGWN